MGLLAKLFKRKPQDELKTMLGDYELPSFPAVLLQARKLLRDDDASNTQIGDCLVQDPGISVRLLKTVNSAALGVRRRVDSVEQAVAMLGRAQVESLLITHGVNAALPKPKRGEYDGRQFWLTAARRATLARSLAARLHPATAGQSFTASLLQDMAVPVLVDVYKDRYEPVLRACHAGEGQLGALERDEFGWDHAVVGSWMCEAWSFPDLLTVSIADHHGSDLPELEAPPAVRAVALLSGEASANDADRLIAYLESEANMEADEVRGLLEAANEDAAELAQLFA